MDLDKVVILFRQNDTLALWGIPYGMNDDEECPTCVKWFDEQHSDRCGERT